MNTECFLGDDDGNVRALRAHQVEQTIVDGRMTFEKVEGSDFELPCELVLLAMGFVGPQRPGLLEQLGVELNERGNVSARRRATRRTVDERVRRAATWAGVRASSCGRSPKAARARRRSTGS